MPILPATVGHFRRLKRRRPLKALLPSDGDQHCVPVISSTERRPWLEAKRALGIGGSESAAVLGRSRWANPLSVYVWHIGAAPLESPDSENAELGHEVEHVVAHMYEKRSERTTYHTRPAGATEGSWLVQSRRYPWMVATIDREIEAVDERGPGILECKFTSDRFVKDWEDEPPIEAQLQVLHNAVVRGFTWGVVAGIVGTRFRWFEVELEPAFAPWLAQQLEGFWKFVQARKVPRDYIRGDGRSAEALSRLYPTGDGSTITLDADAVELTRQAIEADEQIKQWKSIGEDARAKLKERIGAATIGVLPDGSCAWRWAEVKRAGYTVEPTKYRELRRIKGRSTDMSSASGKRLGKGGV